VLSRLRRGNDGIAVIDVRNGNDHGIDIRAGDKISEVGVHLIRAALRCDLCGTLSIKICSRDQPSLRQRRQRWKMT
jgi:hypothetical protein